MSSPNDAASFAAEAKAAMDDLLRARAQSGVARNDPLDPLVLALARTINVLGKMPAAIDQQQKTIITASQAMATKAQADMGVSLSATAKTLVNNLGGAVTAREKWKWTALTAVVIGLVAVGSEWLGQTCAVQNAEARADARIAEMQEKLQEDKALFAANFPSIQRLSGQQLSNLAVIIKYADGWSEIRKRNNAPWPCLKYEYSDRWTSGGKNAAVCITGYGN